jgi:hypothetical protein
MIINENKLRQIIKQEINEHLIQEGKFQDAMNWIKGKGKSAINATKDFLLKLKQELGETKEGSKILIKMVKGNKLTPEESNELTTQAKDLAKGIPLLGLVALPGGGIATIALVKLAKKYNIDLLPTAFRDKG